VNSHQSSGPAPPRFMRTQSQEIVRQMPRCSRKYWQFIVTPVLEINERPTCHTSKSPVAPLQLKNRSWFVTLCNDLLNDVRTTPQKSWHRTDAKMKMNNGCSASHVQGFHSARQRSARQRKVMYLSVLVTHSASSASSTSPGGVRRICLPRVKVASVYCCHRGRSSWKSCCSRAPVHYTLCMSQTVVEERGGYSPEPSGRRLCTGERESTLRRPSWFCDKRRILGHLLHKHTYCNITYLWRGYSVANVAARHHTHTFLPHPWRFHNILFPPQPP